MITQKIDENKYIVKVTNEKITDIDIYNTEEVERFTKELFSSFIKKYNLQGEIDLNFYIDYNYGIIIEITTDDYFSFDDSIDVRISFNLNPIFLYEIDYFDILENTNIKNKNIYYYNNKYYLELLSDIDQKDYNYLLESSNIYYNKNTLDIINKGIKLSI